MFVQNAIYHHDRLQAEFEREQTNNHLFMILKHQDERLTLTLEPLIEGLVNKLVPFMQVPEMSQLLTSAVCVETNIKNVFAHTQSVALTSILKLSTLANLDEHPELVLM